MYCGYRSLTATYPRSMPDHWGRTAYDHSFIAMGKLPLFGSNAALKLKIIICLSSLWLHSYQILYNSLLQWRPQNGIKCWTCLQRHHQSLWQALGPLPEGSSGALASGLLGSQQPRSCWQFCRDSWNIPWTPEVQEQIIFLGPTDVCPHRRYRRIWQQERHACKWWWGYESGLRNLRSAAYAEDQGHHRKMPTVCSVV